jgi:hypothetical protein
MKHLFLFYMFSLGCISPVIAADVPQADAAFRAERVKEYTASCIKGIEDLPDLRAIYSHKTVEVYCVCRQRFSADVLAQAIKIGKRGKAVQDQAADYAAEKCGHILLNHEEHE